MITMAIMTTSKGSNMITMTIMTTALGFNMIIVNDQMLANRYASKLCQAKQHPHAQFPHDSSRAKLAACMIPSRL